MPHAYAAIFVAELLLFLPYAAAFLFLAASHPLQV